MRYRVRQGYEAVRQGAVIARAGEIVDVDLDLDADRRWVEAMGDALQALDQPAGWVDRDDDGDYTDRSMRARRRSNR